jgi:hypothetical protein
MLPLKRARITKRDLISDLAKLIKNLRLCANSIDLKSPLRSINSLISWIKENIDNFDAPTQNIFH